MKTKWVKGQPTEEGWYFWRKRRDTLSPFHWFTYYVYDERCDDEIAGDFSCWADGTSVYWPKGGWWSIIDLPKEG